MESLTICGAFFNIKAYDVPLDVNLCLQRVIYIHSWNSGVQSVREPLK
jgi:hypothetical protein